MSKTALLYHPIYLSHNTGPHHPERASRLQSIFRKLRNTNLINDLKTIEPGMASEQEISLVHSGEYISYIKKICSGLKDEFTHLDNDTVVSKSSFEAAIYAVGAVLSAIDEISKGRIANALCLVRPPGHHARPSRSMGFCIFNNIAVGAAYARRKHCLDKVAIVDWDVHHGNGTEEVFIKDKSVLYISLHQYPHYPGTGESSGEGNINIPMNSGSGDKEYLRAFNDIVIPELSKFEPNLILLSAGFDGHKDDPLSSINLSEEGYGEMTKMLKQSAEKYCQGRMVSVLEGGYNLISLANSVHSHLKSLIQ